MKRRWTAALLLTLVPGLALAGPPYAGIDHDIPQKAARATQDAYELTYCNFCSGWIYYWGGYCGTDFPACPNEPLPSAQIGVCYDLTDFAQYCCAPVNLDQVIWAWKRYCPHGMIDVEVYNADDDCCPAGPPLAGIYDFWVNVADPWQYLDFGGMEIAPPSGKFIVMATIPYPWACAPYSDINVFNIEEGCETEWRCTGHSYVFRNAVTYCDVYGTPGALWASYTAAGCTNYPVIPPGCHNEYHDTGFFSEWLCYIAVQCLGPSRTEEESWSKVKSLYR